MADPFTLAQIANIGVRGLKGILDSRKAAKTMRANEQALGFANAQSALSALGNNPRQFTPNLKQFKPSGFSNFLGGVGTAIDTATTLKSVLDAGRLAGKQEELLDGQITALNQKNAASQQAAQTAIGAGKFAEGQRAGQGIRAAELARQVQAVAPPSGNVAADARSLPVPSFLGGNAGTPQQRAVQRLSQPVGVGQAAGFAAGEAAQAALERQQGQQDFDNNLSRDLLGLNRDRLELQRSKAAFDAIQYDDAQKLAFQLGANAAPPVNIKDEQDLFRWVRQDATRLPFVRDANEIQSSFGKLKGVIEGLRATGFKSGAGQISAVNLFQRLIDPATVREGDVQLLRSAQSILAEAEVRINRLTDGEVISQGLAMEMEKAAEDIYRVWENSAQKTLGSYLDAVPGLGDDLKQRILGSGLLLAPSTTQVEQPSGMLTADPGFMDRTQSGGLDAGEMSAAADLLREALKPRSDTLLGNLGRNTLTPQLRGITLGNR